MSLLNLKIFQIAVILFLSLTIVTSMVSQPESESSPDLLAIQQKTKTLNGKHQHSHNHPHHHHQHRRKHRINKALLKHLPQLKDEVEVFKDLPELKQTRKTLNTTRLRSVSSSDLYRNGIQRRHSSTSNNKNRNSEWDYHTYNILTNTFGPPPPSVPSTSGKGDDNRADVEFIGSSPNRNAEKPLAKPKHGYDYIPSLVPQTTSSPFLTTTTERVTTKRFPMITIPPLVPARRGYTTVSTPKTSNDNTTPSLLPTTTDDPFETNTISRMHPSTTNTKDMERRHICVQQRTVTMPVKTREIYTRPILKHISTPCQPQTHANQMCTRVQLVHEKAVRDVIRHKSAQRVTYDCCTGWMKETPNTDACMKPICSSRCQNGGVCSAPETCSCPAGFTGRFCETDINECKEDKPCDQNCINTIGSYMCKCREGFILQPDQQSCKKVDFHRDDAFEARDLENDIDADDEVDARLQKIERSLANERIQTNQLMKSLQATYNVVDTLKSRLSTLEKQQQDLNRLQTNLYATETRTNKLEGMLNVLMKCMNGPNAYCP